MNKKGSGKKKEEQMTSCDMCAHFAYDELYGEYVCEINLDEDEMYAFLSGKEFSCPYFRNGDEYLIVRKQM